MNTQDAIEVTINGHLPMESLLAFFEVWKANSVGFYTLLYNKSLQLYRTDIKRRNWILSTGDDHGSL